MGKSILAIAPLIPRHYVIMEVKQNLVAADRKELLKRFRQPHFKRVAKVVMGEPAADYKKKVHAQLLEEKQKKSDADWNRKKAEQARRIELAKKKAEAEEKRKVAMEEARKRKEAADAKRKELLEKKKAEEDAKKKAEEEAAGEKKDEASKDEKKDDA